MNWLEMLGWDEEEIDDLRCLGYCYAKQGVYDIAVTFFEALTVLKPHPYDFSALGALYLQTGDGTQSLTYLDQALQLEPMNPETKLNRAKALFLLGYRKQGLQQAHELEQCEDPFIAEQASALILAYK